MPRDRQTPTSRTPVRAARRQAPADAADVLRFPTRRRRAWPRPAQIDEVHPAILRRLAGIYLDISVDDSHEAGCRYVHAMGWKKGLGGILNPVIRHEIEARGGEVEEETG